MSSPTTRSVSARTAPPRASPPAPAAGAAGSDVHVVGVVGGGSYGGAVGGAGSSGVAAEVGGAGNNDERWLVPVISPAGCICPHESEVRWWNCCIRLRQIFL